MSVQTPEKSTLSTAALTLPLNEGYRSLLANRSFLTLWLGQVFSQLADRIVFVVFITLIATHFGSNDSYNSYLYVAFTIPAILLTAIAGVFIDRWPRRLVLVSTNLFRAAFIAFLPSIANHSLLSIYGLAFLISAATQFFVPAEAATIPTLVRKTQLLAANSLFTTTMMASVIFGFALGDPLINIFGLDQVHWSVVGLFLLASVALMFVQIPVKSNSLPVWDDKQPSAENIPNTVPLDIAPKTTTIRGAVDEFFRELFEGIDYIRSHSLVLRSMLKLALLFSTVVAMCILFISFAKVYLYEDPAVATRKFAYIVTFSGIGMALGAFLVGRFFRDTKRSLLVFSGFTLTGLCLVLLAWSGFIPRYEAFLQSPPTHWGTIYLDTFTVTYRMVYTYGLSLFMGVGAGFVAIPLQALLHELIPEDKRGKVLGVQFTILSTSSTLPVLAAGLGVEYLGILFMLYLMGLPLLGVGLWGLKRHQQHQGIGNTLHGSLSAEDW